MRLYLILTFLGVITHHIASAQAPQFSQFYANPLYANPAFAGEGGTPRLIANYRNQWATLGTAYHTAAFSFDTYAEDAGIGLGFQALHDQNGPAIQGNLVNGQVAKMVYLDGQKRVRLIGGLQAGFASSRWNGDHLTYVSDFLGSADPLSLGGFSSNRLTLGAGSMIEYVPKDDYSPSFWAAGAWHNIGIKDNWWLSQQRANIQAGTVIPVDIPSFFGNYLGRDLNRQSFLSLAVQARKQMASHQLDAGFNFTTSPILLGVWYRGLVMGKTRRDALIGTVGIMLDNMMFQASYDVPVSSIGTDTGAFEISIWYTVDTIFSFSSRARQERKAMRSIRF